MIPFSSFERAMILRYLLPGREGRIIVLVASIGMVAVAIGVAALIVVMSVMNGARTKLTIQFAGVDGHASMSRRGEVLADWRTLQAEALRQPAVVSAVPIVETSAMAAAAGRVMPTIVRGIRVADMQTDPILGNRRTVLGALPRQDGDVVLGSRLAASLGLSIGNGITIMLPSFDSDRELSVRSVGFQVVGLIETGLDYDNKLVLMSMSDAQKMIARGDIVNRINLMTRNADRASQLLAPLAAKLRDRVSIRTWRELNKPIFDALAVEQVAMFVALSMIVLVAQFNILSSLMMLVRSKVRDIAILRTMGASRSGIMKVFVTVGTAIGAAGSLLGCAVGLALVSAKDAIALFLKDSLIGRSHSHDLLTLIDLPARIGAGEVSGIVLLALVGTVAATFYPAFRAASVDPASVLRYE